MRDTAVVLRRRSALNMLRPLNGRKFLYRQQELDESG